MSPTMRCRLSSYLFFLTGYESNTYSFLFFSLFFFLGGGGGGGGGGGDSCVCSEHRKPVSL